VTDDARIARRLFIITFVGYAYFFGGGGWNQNANFDLTRSLVESHQIDIDRWAGNTGDRSFHGGHVYANKSPGLSFLAAIPYAISWGAERVAGIDTNGPFVILFNAYLCTVIACGLVAATVPPLLYLYCRRTYGISPRRALLGAIVVAFGTPMFAYSTIFIAHATSAAFLFISFVFSRDAAPRRTLLAGLAGGLAAMTNYLAIPALAVTALHAAFATSDARARRLAMFVAAAVVPLALVAIYQKVAFGGFATTPIESMDPQFVSRDALWLGIIKRPNPEAAWGITFSSQKGMFYLSPFLVLAFAGAIKLLRRREWLDLFTALGYAAIFFGFNITFNNWDGGFGIGARYLLPLVPILGVFAAAGLSGGRLRGVAIALAIISLMNNFAAAAVDPQPSGSFNDPLGQYIYPLLLTGHFATDLPMHPSWSPRFLTGHTGVVRHTFEEIIPFAKYRPGAPPAEWASFNLGEFLLGRGSLLSLIPIVIFLGAMLIMLMRAAAGPHPERNEGPRNA
jgi:hypothetical protein